MANKNVGTLAGEIKQTKPFGSLAHEALLGLLRTNEMVQNFMIETVGLDGITLPQYNVLRILRGAGPNGLPTLEVADRLVERTPGVTRMIDRLIAKELVVRQRCTEDRRVVYCKLTDRGRDLLKKYDRPIERSHRSALNMLSRSETRQLVKLLDKIRAGHEGNGGD
ncbi:MAG: MarR family winged helix-turn-helix transcriptional regulator [Gemmatimonadales bacterium]